MIYKQRGYNRLLVGKLYDFDISDLGHYEFDENEEFESLKNDEWGQEI
jgi:hypothetical protein